jgi:hypothetical protein
MATLKNRSLSLLAWLVVAMFMSVGPGTTFAGDMDEADAAKQHSVNKIIRWMNNTPRKSLDFMTPAEAFSKNCRASI